MLHFVAYLTARAHDTRATLWTIGSLILIFMTVRTLLAAPTGLDLSRHNRTVFEHLVQQLRGSFGTA